MSRPTNGNTDETRRRLVDGALTLFAERGFHGVSTRELAAHAGVNIATLSYHFASKHGLYDTVVDEVYRRLRVRSRHALQVGLPGDVDQLLGELYWAARLERDGIRLLVREVLDHGHLTARTEATHFVPELQYAAKLAAALLGCKIDDARAAAVAVGYLISRYVVQDDASLMVAFSVRSAKQAHQRAIATITTTARALLGRDRLPATKSK